ncbi:MAG TPA: phospholipase D-like domain-containing protein [Candidatus Angelobacter sp.]|nr:phospholipase D-like domain-containing protein [Candidatus Angelobacter sp.]
MSLKVNSYVSDGSVLLAFDMEQPTDDFAGFAIQCHPKGSDPYYLPNRLSFTHPIDKDTEPENRPWVTSDKAPFQKFYWMHFPPQIDTIKEYEYEITAMHFQSSFGLKKGEQARVEVNFGEFATKFHNFTPGFTRGYLSSQAYATGFHNAPIRPAKKTMDFDSKPFEKQWEWLGYSAHKLLFEFLNECLHDKSIHVDLFAYDLDHPDFIRAIVQLGKEKRLRAFLDDAPLHTKKGAIEIDAKKAILHAAGAHNVISGHFKRFAHCKVMVQRKNGKPIKVFTGSANFSIRGLYVQANNVMVINDPKTAEHYGQAFDEAFSLQQKNPKGSAKVATAFAKSPVAAKYFDCSGQGLPKFDVAFSPHTSGQVSLKTVAEAIKQAKTSVIFAVMQLGGSGSVLQQLASLNKRKDIFSYGMTQSAGKVQLFSPGSAQHGEFATFSYLSKNVPKPFAEEYSGGMGQVIHDKFVVVDFNGDNPVVFTGSSNLAEGGETANGDNLLAIHDRDLAVGFAVEGIRLVDHYHFRMMKQQSTKEDPMTLQGPGATGGGGKGKGKKKSDLWWEPYYDKTSPRYNERTLLSHAPGHAASHRRGN